jgi:DNA-binding NarL/FixJ family response regulator
LTALIDIGLPDGSGLELIREQADQGDATIVVTTIFDDDDTLVGAFTAGAHGYLLKSAGPDDVAERLRDLQAGEIAISPSMARRLLGRFRQTAPAEFAALTARETDVLSVIGRGLTLAEAGHALGISGHTVGAHVKTIYGS